MIIKLILKDDSFCTNGSVTKKLHWCYLHLGLFSFQLLFFLELFDFETVLA